MMVSNGHSHPFSNMIIVYRLLQEMGQTQYIAIPVIHVRLFNKEGTSPQPPQGHVDVTRLQLINPPLLYKEHPTNPIKISGANQIMCKNIPRHHSDKVD